MKRLITLLLFLSPILLFAQYPTFSNKQKLGVQTTGDGLIFRGNQETPSYIPNNTNNAYFYLDTLTNRLKFYNNGSWQQVYPSNPFDTTTLNIYLKISDTTAMLLPYFRDSDTTLLNLVNRFALKLNITDTTVMLSPYLKKIDTITLSNRINTKLNINDTTILSNRINLKLNSTDTLSLSNRINKKLDTIYVQYPTYIDTVTNKESITISNTLKEGFGVNIIADSINIDSAVILATQQKQISYVKNQSGITIYKGQAVYSSGSTGDNKLVRLASSSTEQTSSKTFGVVESDSIPNNGQGYIITFGLLSKINTNLLTEGSSVYLSSTPGELTTTKPQAPLHLVTIGLCIRSQQNNGAIFVKIQNGFELDEIHDVRITSPVDNASLYYKSSEQLWRDTTAALLVSDTTTMLSKYVNTYGNQTNINGNKTFNNVITIDSATVTSKLLVNTNISDAVKINTNTISTNLELMNSGGSVYIKSGNKNMTLQTDTTALVYLKGDVNKVGILTMTPQQALEVNGNVRITGLNNNLVPLKVIGSDNNGDLTNVNLGQGLSFTNDTLKVDLTIIDTAIAASAIVLTGHVTGTGNTNSSVNTTISNNVVTNNMLVGGISNDKLDNITATGKVANSSTTATNLNTNNAIVSRDGSGNFSAGTITATLNGNATSSTFSSNLLNYLNSNESYRFKSTNAISAFGQLTVTTPGTDFSIARSDAAQTFTGTQTFSNTINGSITGNAGSVTDGVYTSRSISTTSPLQGGGDLSANRTLSILQANTSTSGFLSNTDWNTFNNKLSTTTAASTYLPLTGGTLTGNLFGTNQGLSSNLTISDIIPGNSAPIFTTITTGPSSSATVRFGLNQSLSGDANMFMGGTQGLGGNPTNPNIYFTDSRKAYASIGGIHTSGGTNNQSGHIVFNTTPSVNTIALTERMRIAQDGLVSINNSLNIGGTINRQEGSHDGSSSTFYYNILNYFAKRDNNKGGATAQITFTDRPGTATFENNVRTSDIYLMTAKNFNGSQLGQFLDTTFSVVANQDGGRIGISKLNPAYKLDVNGTFNASGNGLIGGTFGVTGTTTLSDDLILQTSGARTETAIRHYYAQQSRYAGEIRFRPEGSGGSKLSFLTNLSGFGQSERMTITENGDVGINTTTPSYKLNVNGTLGVVNSATFFSNLSANGTITLSNLGGNGNRMVITNNNGVLSTQAIPTVTSVSGTAPISVENGTTTPSITIADASGNVSGVVNTTTQTFAGEKTFTSNVVISGTSNITVGSTGTFGGRVNTPWLERVYTTNTSSTHTVSVNTTWLNMHVNLLTTLTLPNPVTYPGKELYIKQTGTGSVISASANIIGFQSSFSSSPVTSILDPALNKCVTLVSDGTYWIIMQRGN